MLFCVTGLWTVFACFKELSWISAWTAWKTSFETAQSISGSHHTHCSHSFSTCQLWNTCFYHQILSWIPLPFGNNTQITWILYIQYIWLNAQSTTTFGFRSLRWREILAKLALGVTCFQTNSFQPSRMDGMTAQSMRHSGVSARSPEECLHSDWRESVRKGEGGACCTSPLWSKWLLVLSKYPMGKGASRMLFGGHPLSIKAVAYVHLFKTIKPFVPE